MTKKKNKKDEQLPEGMSRKQAKLAARAAERAALEKDPRPYGDLSFETDLVAMQEFVPSAIAKVEVPGSERDVYLCTVLPGGVAAVIRTEDAGGDAFVALQAQKSSQNLNRDLAFSLAWTLQAEPGQTLNVGIADGTEPKITEILAPEQDLNIEEFDNFNWWVPEGTDLQGQFAQAISAANDTLVPSERVVADIAGTTWWVNPGDKAHIRWVRAEDENKLIRALARIAARGELKLGEETKFAGVFRTAGLLVPVWDLDPERDPSSYVADLEALDAKIAAELDNDAQLNPEERKQRENILSRSVTIR